MMMWELWQELCSVFVCVRELFANSVRLCLFVRRMQVYLCTDHAGLTNGFQRGCWCWRDHCVLCIVGEKCLQIFVDAIVFFLRPPYVNIMRHVNIMRICKYYAYM